MTTNKKTKSRTKARANSYKVKSASFGFKNFKFSKVQLLIVAIVVVAIGTGIILHSFADAPMVKLNFPPVAIVDSGSSTGYVLAASDGGIFNYGGSAFHGSLGNLGGNLSAPIVGIADQISNGTDTGYFMVGADGAVYAFGSARYAGGMNNNNGAPMPHTGSVVGIAASSTGGYWILDSTGQIYTFGGAPYLGGSPSGYTGHFVGIAATPSGNGYWLVDNYGQVYSYGDALYKGGSPTGVSNIVGITAGPPGGGYWLVGSDGGVFSYGAPFYGSMGGQPLNAPVVGITHTPDYRGYWLAAADGGIFSFGDAQYEGRPQYTPPPPSLVNRSAVVVSGQSVSTNVVAGVANNPLASSLSIVNDPSHGSAAVSSSGVVTYNSTSGYSGGDSLTYRVCSSVEAAICATSQIFYSVKPAPVVRTYASNPVGGHSSSPSVGGTSSPSGGGGSYAIPAPIYVGGGNNNAGSSNSSSASSSSNTLASIGRCQKGIVPYNVTLNYTSPFEKGSCIIALQDLLMASFISNSYNYRVNATGYFGSGTCRAVVVFKQLVDRNISGNLGSPLNNNNCIVGENVWYYLATYSSHTCPPPATLSGSITVPGGL